MTRSEFYAKWPYNTTDHLIHHYRLSCGFAGKNNGMGNDGVGKARNLWDWLAIIIYTLQYLWSSMALQWTIVYHKSMTKFRKKQAVHLATRIYQKRELVLPLLNWNASPVTLVWLTSGRTNFLKKNWRINTKKSKIIFLDLAILHRSGFNRTEEFWSTWTW